MTSAKSRSATAWLIVLITLAACGVAPLRAQGAKPQSATVTATITPPTLTPNTDAVIEITVDVPAGLHAQSHTPTEKNFIAFTVTLDPHPAIEPGEIVYPSGEA